MRVAGTKGEVDDVDSCSRGLYSLTSSAEPWERLPVEASDDTETMLNPSLSSIVSYSWCSFVGSKSASPWSSSLGSGVLHEVIARHIAPGSSSTEDSPGDGDFLGRVAGPNICGESGCSADFCPELKWKAPMPLSAVKD